MSDSEDDFMSDKFLVDTGPPAKSTTYSEKRSAAALKSLRSGQAKNKIPLKQLEEQRRREGLSTSLFDRPEPTASSSRIDSPSAAPPKPAGAAMSMMMKMGWKVGEGLGRKRSPSPPSTSKRVKEDEDRGGIGSRAKITSNSQTRVEPLRISLWSGRKGISARSPSPPPLPNPANRNPDALDPRKLERLGKETEDFRTRQRREFAEKEVERKEYKARERLMQFEAEQGIKVGLVEQPKLICQFHPLYVMPTDPLGTLPRPLLKLIYPAQALSPSPTGSPEPILTKESNLSAAEKLREQMRRDMLTELNEDQVLGLDQVASRDRKEDQGDEKDKMEASVDDETDWQAMVSGTKKVLSMEVSQLSAFDGLSLIACSLENTLPSSSPS